MNRFLLVAVLMVLGGCGAQQIETTRLGDLPDNCRHEATLTANRWRTNVNRILAVPLSEGYERVLREAEQTCLNRPLNAAEQSAANQRQQQAAEAERRRIADEERIARENRERQEAVAAITAACGAPVEGYAALLRSSPFAIAGRCFLLPVVAVDQWISPREAMVVQNSVLLESPQTIQTTMMGNVIVRGIGPYTYETVMGASRTVPRVLLIIVPSR